MSGDYRDALTGRISSNDDCDVSGASAGSYPVELGSVIMLEIITRERPPKTRTKPSPITISMILQFLR